MNMRSSLRVAVVCAGVMLATSTPATSKSLQIYFIDVEGGQATLIVSPSHQSVVVDTGWADFKGRDSGRIVAAAQAAHVKRIDYVVITHYHADHVGGVTQLAERMKIGTFVDHGPNIENSESSREGYAAYQKVITHASHVTVRPGQGLSLRGMTVEVVTAGGEHIDSPLPGAGIANPHCASEPQPGADASENAQSIGLLITFGRFRFLDLGDLTTAKELELVCPNNLVGAVDVFLVSHHGLGSSNSKALLAALHPGVAILNNGARKGGDPEAWQRVRESPGLEDLWQLHYAVAGGNDHNVAEGLIANPEDQADAGFFIKLVAEPDGSFTVSNSRNKFRKMYRK